jgi:hypothetical protein
MLRLDPAERASVPEIFNHFWLRASNSGQGSSGREGGEREIKKSNSTIFQTISAFSREGSDRSREHSKSPTPSSNEKNNNGRSMDTDSLSAMLDSIDGEAGVSASSPDTADDATDLQVMPKVFKLVPLRRSSGSANSVGDSSNNDSPGRPGSRPPINRPELHNPTRTRARAMINDQSDSLRDLTDAVSITSQNSSSSLRDQGRGGRSRSASRASVDMTAPEPPYTSPKTSRNSLTFFSNAGNASLNTHGTTSASSTARGRPPPNGYDSPARGGTGRADYK